MTKELENKNLQNNETENLSQVELQVGLPFKFTHLDLFSGIGGFALAAKRTWGERYQNVGFCEIDEFCHKVLKKNFGNEINIIKDISDLNGEKFRSVKLITEDSLASRSVESAINWGKMMSVTSGKKCLEYARRLNRDGLLQRMLMGLLIWHWTESLHRWKIYSINQKFSLYQLQPSGDT